MTYFFLIQGLRFDVFHWTQGPPLLICRTGDFRIHFCDNYSLTL